MSEPILIDVRAILKPQRHPLLFAALEELAIGESLIVQNDHNPIPLRGQVETIYGGQFEWNYLAEGPDEFRLQFTRRMDAPQGWARPERKNTLLMAPEGSTPSAAQVDLLELARAASHSGPQWGHECEDLDMTLLSWENGKRIEPHINAEVDVVWVGIEGEGIATINGEQHQLRPGVALLIPKSSKRGVESTSARLSYFSIHRRRRGLMPTLGGKPL